MNLPKAFLVIIRRYSGAPTFSVRPRFCEWPEKVGVRTTDRAAGFNTIIDAITESLGLAARVEDASGGLELVGGPEGAMSLVGDWGALSVPSQLA